MSDGYTRMHIPSGNVVHFPSCTASTSTIVGWGYNGKLYNADGEEVDRIDLGPGLAIEISATEEEFFGE